MPHPTIPYHLPPLSAEANLAAAEGFHRQVASRRSVLEFSDRPTPEGAWPRAAPPTSSPGAAPWSGLRG